MECSLFGQIDGEKRLETLLSRLKSMCSQCSQLTEQVDAFQTSTGTKSSSMARIKIDQISGYSLIRYVLNLYRLLYLMVSDKFVWIETAADVTQNTETSVCCVTEVKIDEGNPQEFLLGLGYLPGHSYQIQGYQFSQFKTPEKLTVKVFKIVREHPTDVYLVKLSLMVSQTSEIQLAELLVKQYASFLSEYPNALYNSS